MGHHLTTPRSSRSVAAGSTKSWREGSPFHSDERRNPMQQVEVKVINRSGQARPYRRGDRLEDGERLIVPNVFMDHAPYGFRPTFADGTPDHTSPHRPGYRFADIDDANRLAAEAYEERRMRLENAWRKHVTDDAPAQRTDAASARAIADRAYRDKCERLQNSWRLK